MPRALAGCGKQPFGAPLDGGLGVITCAAWLARADASTTAEATQQELHHVQCVLHCVQRVADSGA
jgi:hypothetical protein